MPTTNFDFNNLAPQSVPVLWRGKTYVLREPSEGAWSEYEGALDTARQFDEAGKFKGLGDGWRKADAILVAGCLFEVRRDDETERGISLDEVRQWPHRIVDPLVEWCKAAAEAPKVEDLPKSSAAGPGSSA